MPIRLLYISGDGQEKNFKLVDRTDVKLHFKSVPGDIYKEFRNERLFDREGSIRKRMAAQRALVSRYIDGTDEKTSGVLPHMLHRQNKQRREFPYMHRIPDLEEGENGERVKVDIWFTRGWTLQELLAPSRIKFYGADWKPLIPLRYSESDRVSMTIMRKISTITHIPLEDLESFIPGTNRVPEKMLWASKRRTTRIEDTAYSLIGIFDVSLMIAYGEGNRAFFRLMEEIMKRYDKWDMFLWSGQCSHYNATLPEAPRCYPVGYRETLVKRPHEAGNEEEWNTASCGIGDRLFALTNHGLRIKVLVLDVDLRHTTDESHDSRCLTFGRAEFEVVAVRHIGAKREPRCTIWAIGILDYWVDVSGMGFIDRSREFTAFLLSMDRNPSPDPRWKKEMTKEVIKIQPDGHVGHPLSQLYL
ncbi:hypothetical protein DEU56DRAFT_840989 [Suillus clintonianus]|uniref:uncharacterized protein n=1 Tax=Suillus clintonianus TaxID=1904413 RepID=UPI001B87808A|nr:uncharacterized protein DEU56DRAFT_840989 [Suillus clintonianus]KAG2115485.1 hypothetical protein DEU56DRAFT_840989 [Suillus clintonianus]